MTYDRGYTLLRRRSLLTMPILALPVSSGKAQSLAQGQFINILTATTGGVFYPLGGVLKDVFATKIPGSRPSVQATRGSVENLNILQSGKAEIAFTEGVSLAAAWVGNADMGFKQKLDKLRGIASLYSSYIQIIASQASGIKTIGDLKGKRLSVGAKISGTQLSARVLLKAAGITYDDLQVVEYVGFEESVDHMKNRELDASFQVVALGGPALVEFASTFPATFVEIPADVIDRAGAPYVKSVIPKGTYKGQDADVRTAALPNFLVTAVNQPDDLVYAMVKAIFDSTAQLIAVHPAAKGINLESALVGMPIPLHPGAQRFYREKGMIK